MRRLIFLCILLIGCGNDPKVVGIIDGDTIKVLDNQTEIKIRLSDIDCPERKQAFGTKAKQATSDLAFGKNVKLNIRNKDRYGRTVAEVILPNGEVLNKELVRLGYAWHYKRYSKDNSYRELEIEARKNHRGLWIEKNPISPWEYRKHESR